MDRGAGQDTVHGIAKSQTRLCKELSFFLSRRLKRQEIDSPPEPWKWCSPAEALIPAQWDPCWTSKLQKSKEVNICCFKSLIGKLLGKQMETSTVGLKFLHVTGERALLSTKTVNIYIYIFLPGNTGEKKGIDPQLLQEEVKAPRLHICWKHRLHGRKPLSLVLSASLPQSSDSRPPGPHPLPQPVDSAQRRPEQMTPESCLCLQSCCPQPREGHLHTWDSFPVQFRSSSQIGPDPTPKWADPVALRASPQPSCLHTTRASSRSQLSSQMVPQEPWSRISTLPAQGPPPSTRRSCLLSEEREKEQWGGDLGNEKGFPSCRTLTWAVGGALLWGRSACWFRQGVVALGHHLGLVSWRNNNDQKSGRAEEQETELREIMT